MEVNWLKRTFPQWRNLGKDRQIEPARPPSSAARGVMGSSPKAGTSKKLSGSVRDWVCRRSNVDWHSDSIKRRSFWIDSEIFCDPNPSIYFIAMVNGAKLGGAALVDSWLTMEEEQCRSIKERVETVSSAMNFDDERRNAIVIDIWEITSWRLWFVWAEVFILQNYKR